jgi:hypothetical protein
MLCSSALLKCCDSYLFGVHVATVLFLLLAVFVSFAGHAQHRFANGHAAVDYLDATFLPLLASHDPSCAAIAAASSPGQPLHTAAKGLLNGAGTFGSWR